MSAPHQPKEPAPAAAAPASAIAEVRYSLPAMLAEVKIERAAAFFAMEKFDQGEIKKLFKGRASRRVKSKK